MAIDVVTYALAKKYVEESLTGAGALKGQQGLSAYEVAVQNGYSGTEAEWLASLKGQTGNSPTIGENGNWFIDDVDTGIAAKSIHSYNELEDLPTIPSKTSQLTNDSDFITKEDLGKKQDILTAGAHISINENIISADYTDEEKQAIADLHQDKIIDIKVNGSSVVTNKIANIDISEKQDKISAGAHISITNNVISADYTDEEKQAIADLHQDKITDIKVNGSTVVENGIANISLADLDTTIGEEITCADGLGGIKAGTTFAATTTLAEIIKKLLVGTAVVSSSSIYVGVSSAIPTSLNGLTAVATTRDNLLATTGYTYKNITTDNQYVVLALPKSFGLECYQITTSGFAIGFAYTEDDNYYYYYDSTPSTLSGARYIYYFEEA